MTAVDEPLFDDLLGVSDVAELAGVTRSAVTNWRARGTDDFPLPAQEAKSGPLYRRSEVVAWLVRREGRATGQQLLGMEASLWAASDRLRGNIDASQYRHVVLVLLFLRYATDGVMAEKFGLPNNVRWGGIATARPERTAKVLRDAIEALEAASPELDGAFPQEFPPADLDPRRLSGLVEILDGLAVADSTDGRDLLGRAYEYFLGRFASLEGRSGGEFYTPTSVVRLLVELLEPDGSPIYDPCCGSGGMFVQTQRFLEAKGAGPHDLKVFGQELNAATWRLARLNLALHGLAGDLGGEPADAFHEDRHQGTTADFVLANPPFNQSDWGASDLVSDSRWQYGVAPEGNANLAWVQHIVAHLSATGRAGIVLPNGSLSSSNSQERKIREGLLADDLVECMVALPSQMFYSTTIPVTLWILSRRKLPERAREVLFIDASGLGQKVSRTHRALTDEDIEAVAGVCRTWRTGHAGGSVPGFSAAVKTDSIDAPAYSLSPKLYVAPEDNEMTDTASVAELLSEFKTLTAELANVDDTIISELEGLG